MQSVFSTNGRRPKGLKSTYVRSLFSNNILRFFRASLNNTSRRYALSE